METRRQIVVVPQNKTNVWVWVSLGIIGGATLLGILYYIRERRLLIEDLEKRNRDLNEYLLSAIRFTESDFASMGNIIDLCREQNTNEENQLNCIYENLLYYINVIKRGTPVSQWEQADIKKFIDFLKYKGLGKFTAEYEAYLEK